jgi:hypothetical protein
MRFSLALAATFISLATALPTKRELVAPFNNDAGEGLIPSVGQGVDTLINTGGGLVAGAVRAGDDSEEVGKRDLVAPFNNDAGEGLIPGVGQAVDAGIDTVGGLVAGAVRAGDDSGEYSKRELVFLVLGILIGTKLASLSRFVYIVSDICWKEFGLLRQSFNIFTSKSRSYVIVCVSSRCKLAEKLL